MNAPSIIQPLSEMSEKDLMRLEREIAHRHIGKFPWGSVVWCFANITIWLSLWPLVFSGILPLWAACIIACCNVALCYLPSHEAQHDIIARPGEKLRWLNQLVGHISTIPLVLPYRVAKLTHMEHHKWTNHSEFDPDYKTRASGPIGSLLNSLIRRQPRAEDVDSYGEALQRIGREDVILDGVIYRAVFYTVLFALSWNGLAIEAALLLWLPQHFGQTYLEYYLSWAPHHPANQTGRYRDTRSFKSAVGNVLSMGMQYHIVHHLHPRIPLMRTPRAYWEMREILEARGCEISEL